MVSSKLSVCTKVGKKCKSQFEGFKLAMTDVKTYVFALAYMCITGASGFQVCTKVGKKFWKPEAPVMHIYAKANTYVLTSVMASLWKLLSPEMRKVAQRRLAIEAGQADVDEGGSKSQFVMASLKPSNWLLLPPSSTSA
jgi:hypothetical protein